MSQEIRSYGVFIRYPDRTEQLRLLYAYSASDAVAQAKHEHCRDRYGIGGKKKPEGQRPRIVEVGPAKYMRLKHEGNAD